MGNTQSTSPARRNTVPLRPETNGSSAVLTPRPSEAIDTSQVTQAPAKDEEDGATPQTVQRRKSLMKFSSLRRRPRSDIGLAGQKTDSEIISPASPSRRRWRAFSGLKNRPVSTIADPSSPATDLQPLQETSPQPPTGPTPSEKGKERETEGVDATYDVESSVPSKSQGTANEAGPSVPAIGNQESEPSPAAMLQELRDLQDSLSTRNEPRLNSTLAVNGESNSDNSQSQIERPPTPIPTSAMDPPPVSEGDSSMSHAALAEALGSWLSGRARAENRELGQNDTPIASSSRLRETGPSSAQTPHNYTSLRPNSESDLFSSLARNSPRSGNTRGGSFMPSVPLPPSPSASRFGQSSPPPASLQDRRTLPPAGTGTLVVVQGVVHTTDVRHTPSSTPLESQPAATSSARRPRSTSSTPTLRAPTPAISSQSTSRASTPQPQPHSSTRRGRFSSLTSSLRPRSRPRTPSSFRNTGPGGWQHIFTDPGTGSGNHSASETASERSLRVGPAVGSNAADSENRSMSASPDSSSGGATISTDDTSIQGSLPANLHSEHAGDAAAPQGEPQERNRGEGEEGLATSDDQMNDGRGSNGGDGIFDDDSEAELSASSIEVLGTLLSVATAATAASLVTGTTDPLFSSGLGGPLAHPNNTSSVARGSSPPNPSPPFSRSGSSTTSPGGADNSAAEAAVNTRMRAAWESLRDRFSRTRGRRGGETVGDHMGEAREDPREQMLREMARAFNAGLGLDAEAPNETRAEQRADDTREETPREGASVSDTSRPSPEMTPAPDVNRISGDPASPSPGPEGSFERFLHNLQVDLRTALTEDYAARRARAQARTERAAANPVAASSSDAASTPNTDFNPETVDEDRERDAAAWTESMGTYPQIPDLIPTVPNTPRTANLDLPPLPGNANARQGDGQNANIPPPQAQGVTGQPGAGINWWRLYRFPPMQLTPHPVTPNSTSSAAGVPATAPPRSISPETRASATPGSSFIPNNSPERPLPPSGSEAPPNQNVVPVIVVGLQSVPVNRGAAHQQNHEPMSPFGARSADDVPPSTDIPMDLPDRDRAWPLRAASRAFGRMGRRAEADLPQNVNPTLPDDSVPGGTTRSGRHGGRTYLIFVIGGYYPPNHSIVTGADDMNSFEALWELAELLGQVKPPVASKEDIEKSGLEIVKAVNLSDYEKRGKVASNTVERCLICLDDYDPEDDLRLLSCRHIFHRQCVDKWLEQGRNNCPACRSKGVRTGDDPLMSPSPTPEIPSEIPPRGSE